MLTEAPSATDCRTGVAAYMVAERAGTSHATLAANEAAGWCRESTRSTVSSVPQASLPEIDLTPASRRDRRCARGEGRGAAAGARARGDVPGSARVGVAGSLGSPGASGMSREPVRLPDADDRVHSHLRAAGFGHAFGGALALAWCTSGRGHDRHRRERLRRCRTQSTTCSTVLPEGCRRLTRLRASAVCATARRGCGGTRTPVDVFLNTTDVPRRGRDARAMGEFRGTSSSRSSSCSDLAVFKAFFNRTKDWADLEAMRDAGTLDVSAIAGVETVPRQR